MDSFLFLSALIPLVAGVISALQIILQKEYFSKLAVLFSKILLMLTVVVAILTALLYFFKIGSLGLVFPLLSAFLVMIFLVITVQLGVIIRVRKIFAKKTTPYKMNLLLSISTLVVVICNLFVGY